MSKPAKKRPVSSSATRAAAAMPSQLTVGSSKGHKANAVSKQSRVITMLQSPPGATIAAMMNATGWQQRSVRGFLAGVVRKKLKLKLASEKVDGTRIYRVDDGDNAKAGGRKAKRRAA